MCILIPTDESRVEHHYFVLIPSHQCQFVSPPSNNIETNRPCGFVRKVPVSLSYMALTLVEADEVNNTKKPLDEPG